MPWSEQSKMDIRYAAIKEYMIGRYSLQEVADCYGISRQTLYKWIKRFHEGGLSNLEDRSSRPVHLANATDPKLVKIILDLNEEKGWLGRKIHGVIDREHPEFEIPSITTVHNILHRAGRCRKYRKPKTPTSWSSSC